MWGGDALQLLNLHLLQLGVLDKFGRVSSSFWTTNMAFPTTTSFRLFTQLEKFPSRLECPLLLDFLPDLGPKAPWEISYCIRKAPGFSLHLIFGSLMQEYHHFRALPYTFPSDRHEVSSNVWPQLAQQQLQGLWQSWAGRHLSLLYVSNTSSLLCTWWLLFLKHKLHHQASENHNCSLL